MISLSELREDQCIGVRNDDDLRRLRDAVVALFEKQTGRKWSKSFGKVENRSTPGCGGRVIYLSLTVDAITSVEERSKGEAVWSELEAASYDLTAASGRLERLGDPWKDRIRVTYDGGFDASDPASVPGDIREALLIQARYMRQRFAPERIALQGRTAKGSGATFYIAEALHPFFRETVEAHRRG